MELLIVLALVVATFTALAISVRRARLIARCACRQGNVQVLAGRLPPKVMIEVREVASRQRVQLGFFDVVREGGRPRVIVRAGIDAGTAQRLRNVIGRFTLAELR